LTDDKTLESSVKAIYFGYLGATKTSGSSLGTPAYIENKSDWQMRSEAAYSMLTEAKQLEEQLASLIEAIGTLAKDRNELGTLISDLGKISGVARQKTKSENRTTASETTDSDYIATEVATALNRIFSEPPKETGAKTDAAKTDGAKTDAAKKDAAKTDAAKKDAAKTDAKNAAKMDE
jgi:hypothetical protein